MATVFTFLFSMQNCGFGEHWLQGISGNGLGITMVLAGRYWYEGIGGNWLGIMVVLASIGRC